MLETQVSADDVLAAAVDKNRFPTRRFRVEGTHVGNSRLLSERDAQGTALRYGGQMVELVTRETFVVAQAKTSGGSGLPECVRATCFAEAGKPCRNKAGEICSAHACRFGEQKPTFASAAKNLPACPVEGCAASRVSGMPCTTPKGKPRMPHKGRAPKVDQPGAML